MQCPAPAWIVHHIFDFSCNIYSAEEKKSIFEPIHPRGYSAESPLYLPDDPPRPSRSKAGLVGQKGHIIDTKTCQNYVKTVALKFITLILGKFNRQLLLANQTRLSQLWNCLPRFFIQIVFNVIIIFRNCYHFNLYHTSFLYVIRLLSHQPYLPPRVGVDAISKADISAFLKLSANISILKQCNFEIINIKKCIKFFRQ